MTKNERDQTQPKSYGTTSSPLRLGLFHDLVLFCALFVGLGDPAMFCSGFVGCGDLVLVRGLFAGLGDLFVGRGPLTQNSNVATYLILENKYFKNI